MRAILFILMISGFTHCFSQSFKKLSRYEKRWALAHPFAALKVKKISKACYALYYQPDVKLQLDSFSNGGQLDAFRHSFFMAAYAQKTSSRKLRKLGIAHEKANYRQFLNSEVEEGEIPDSLSTVMDLQNNEAGINIGKKHKNESLEVLKNIVIAEIKNGGMLIMKRNRAGNYLDCSGHPIDVKNMPKQWQLPKCLVHSR